MPKGLFLWQSEAGKYLKFRGPLKPNQERLNQYARTFLIGKDCKEDIRSLIDKKVSQDPA
jgi:hypothetical protein